MSSTVKPNNTTGANTKKSSKSKKPATTTSANNNTNGTADAAKKPTPQTTTTNKPATNGATSNIQKSTISTSAKATTPVNTSTKTSTVTPTKQNKTTNDNSKQQNKPTPNSNLNKVNNSKLEPTKTTKPTPVAIQPPITQVPETIASSTSQEQAQPLTSKQKKRIRKRKNKQQAQEKEQESQKVPTAEGSLNTIEKLVVSNTIAETCNVLPETNTKTELFSTDQAKQILNSLIKQSNAESSSANTKKLFNSKKMSLSHDDIMNMQQILNNFNGYDDDEEEDDDDDDDILVADDDEEEDDEVEYEDERVSKIDIDEFKRIHLAAAQGRLLQHPDIYENQYFERNYDNDEGDVEDEDDEDEEDDEYEDVMQHELFVSPQKNIKSNAFMKPLLIQEKKQVPISKRIESPEPAATFNTTVLGGNADYNYFNKYFKSNGINQDDDDDNFIDQEHQLKVNPNAADGNQATNDEFCSDNEEQEDVGDYCKGGYHPVKIGDLYNQRYHVLRKLGWGHFSTVWLCWDFKGVRFVALKIVKSAKHYTEAAADEIKLLQCARDGDPIDENRFKTVQLLDNFKVTGPNGVHVCMVFEVLGNNLLKLIIKSNYHGIPLQNVKIIVKQVLQGLDYLHRKCQIIHTDMKPENVLMCVDETHVRHLAQEAAEWQKMGIKPSGSAIATVCAGGANGSILGNGNDDPNDPNNNENCKMSRNKKKKLRKKQKRIQTLLDTQQKQIELSKKENLNLLGYDNDDNKATLILDVENTETTTVVDTDNNTEVVRRQMKTSTSIYNCDLASVENKRLSKLMSIVQDVNIDKIVQSPSSNTIKDLQQQQTSDAAGNVDGDAKSKKKTRRRQKKKKAAAAGATTTTDPTTETKDINEVQSSSLENGDGDEENKEEIPITSKSTTSVSQQVAELKRKHLNPVFEVVQDEKNLQVKIADLGNACWTYHHFTEDIQTRQYRSLEVILGSGYNTSADIWSLACMAFELATGDYLFEPHSGENYTRDEDHIAHIIELLGPIPYDIALNGKYSGEFFTKRGQLRHINQLRPWELYEVLTEKYEWAQRDAAEFSDFLIPMLNYNIYERATALECLNHPWITGNYSEDYIYRTVSSFASQHSNAIIVQNGNVALASATIPPHPMMMAPNAANSAYNVCYSIPNMNQMRTSIAALAAGGNAALNPQQHHHLLEGKLWWKLRMRR